MAFLAPLLLAGLSESADAQTVWTSGAYSFSDELGGFHITGVSGSGSKDDPFVVTEELNSATPVTLTIRAVADPAVRHARRVCHRPILYAH